MSTLGRKAWGDLTRHRGRTLLAAFTLCIAIATLGFLAVPGLLSSAMNRQVQASHLNDVGISTQIINLSPAQLQALGQLPGVAAVSPVLAYTATATSAAGKQNIAIAGGNLASAAVNTVPLMSGRLPGPDQALADVGNARATGYDAKVGQSLTFSLAQGPQRVRVIGIDTGGNANGAIVYFPLRVLERLDGNPGRSDSIGISTASSAHAAIDRATSAAAARLDSAGYPVSTSELYVVQRQATAQEASLLAIVEILGLLVVAIMLLGLASALSMGVLERTREVGILRCVGARARNIRRVFSAEAMVLAFAGWVAGIVVGWLIYEGLIVLVRHAASLILPQEFVPAIPLITLAGVVILTLLVIRGPLRRATRIQPGLALRYQ